jgi:hypothetical protein
MFTTTKYIGAALVLAGIPLLIAAHATFGSELPLITGLFLLFFTKEKQEDERAQQLRASALMISFATGYIFEVATTYLHGNGVLPFQLGHPRYFVIFVLTLAIVIFYSRLLGGTNSKPA